MNKSLKTVVCGIALIAGLSFISNKETSANLAYWAASSVTDSGIVQNGAAGAGGTAGAYAGAWAAAKVGAAIGTTVGPVGTAAGAIIGAGIGAA